MKYHRAYEVRQILKFCEGSKDPDIIIVIELQYRFSWRLVRRTYLFPESGVLATRVRAFYEIGSNMNFLQSVAYF